jgi:hypothetical protein
MATAATAQALGTATPYGSRAGARRVVIARHGRVPYLGHQINSHQKIERKMGHWP